MAVMSTEPKPPPEIVESSHLTDADWAQINKLQSAWQAGGSRSISKALVELAAADPGSYICVVAAYFPDVVREALKDQMAEQGMSEDDLRELIRRLESPAGKQ